MPSNLPRWDHWIDESLAVDVGHFKEWVSVGLSDHVPLVVEVNPRVLGAGE
jgi:hypothetical protein